ncbi:UNKNOWN [Stylonychia lemnae]|uniref:Uncharacterized protein n=1 Tax=Stylonychia lemnae TaxID=5949 RepID=A0A077ZY92_STYLE|nr:UNKNOWN [Stylonychia lemnae]|eukprot:CDW73521.1 UNKNOWN [Stylonychia lemnae]
MHTQDLSLDSTKQLWRPLMDIDIKLKMQEYQNQTLNYTYSSAQNIYNQPLQHQPVIIKQMSPSSIKNQAIQRHHNKEVKPKIINRFDAFRQILQEKKQFFDNYYQDLSTNLKTQTPQTVGATRNIQNILRSQEEGNRANLAQDNNIRDDYNESSFGNLPKSSQSKRVGNQQYYMNQTLNQISSAKVLSTSSADGNKGTQSNQFLMNVSDYNSQMMNQNQDPLSICQFILPSTLLRKNNTKRPLSSYQQKMNKLKQPNPKKKEPDILCGKKINIKNFVDIIHEQAAFNDKLRALGESPARKAAGCGTNDLINEDELISQTQQVTNSISNLKPNPIDTNPRQVVSKREIIMQNKHQPISRNSSDNLIQNRSGFNIGKLRSVSINTLDDNQGSKERLAPMQIDIDGDHQDSPDHPKQIVISSVKARNEDCNSNQNEGVQEGRHSSNNRSLSLKKNRIPPKIIHSQHNNMMLNFNLKTSNGRPRVGSHSIAAKGLRTLKKAKGSDRKQKQLGRFIQQELSSDELTKQNLQTQNEKSATVLFGNIIQFKEPDAIMSRNLNSNIQAWMKINHNITLDKVEKLNRTQIISESNQNTGLARDRSQNNNFYSQNYSLNGADHKNMKNIQYVSSKTPGGMHFQHNQQPGRHYDQIKKIIWSRRVYS